MARKVFSENEINELKKNKYVSDVEETRICYTNEFKFHFMNEYQAGKNPARIFKEAGFDTKVLGPKRIERAADRWKKSYAAGSLGSYKDGTIRRQKDIFENDNNSQIEDEGFIKILKNQQEVIDTLKREISILENQLKSLYIERTQSQLQKKR